MKTAAGLRERKKRETRHRLGDVAARLFAEKGYDAVSMSDVARAADVAAQTVFNYFPTKPDLVLDRADEILERTRRVVAERELDESPADALRVLVREDIERFRTADPVTARGEFPAQCVVSESLRRHALAFRQDQAEAVARAIVETAPELTLLVARAHASAVVAIVHAVTERIGTAILGDYDRDVEADDMWSEADAALSDAAENFQATRARAFGESSPRG